MATEMVPSETGGFALLQGQKLLENPVLRQLGVMIGVALSVALGIAVVLWSQTPSYSPLYGNLSQQDAPVVMDALQQAGIRYKVDESSGAVMVPSTDLQNARMKLAGLGLPRSDNLGFELLQQESGFGTSHSMEMARFQRALEGELARSIATLAPIESARVHLATPKQSVFVRDRKYPSASVVLKLYPGRILEQSQAESIVHLVAASVPELAPERVTVVDQQGRLLSGEDRSKGMGLTTAQFEYTRELEQHYSQRIQDILTPVLGAEALRAQVTAELDFTLIEQTQELYNPDQPALRSEQTQEQTSSLSPVQGVPGALSNQPPAAGTSPQQAVDQKGTAKPEPVNGSKRATRNYELDKTISHTRRPSGNLRRLSVAVVVDDRTERDAQGKATHLPRTPEELTRIETLVREAIGYDARRGDSIQVVNAAFQPPVEMAPLPEPPLWQQPWVWDVARQVGGLVLVLVLIFGVLRPALKRLTTPATVAGLAGVEGERAEGQSEEGLEGELADEERAAALAALPPGEKKIQLQGPRGYDDILEAARQLVRDDPKRVAQVVRRWLMEEAA